MSSTQASAATPVPAYTEQPHSASVAPMNPLDNFFGYTISLSATSESRHDNHRVSLADSPPAYNEDVLPEYTEKDEPTTLAQYLFWFGFVFFPFWVLGAWILVSPLRIVPEDASWLSDKTEAELEAFVLHMRKAELKWAKRCLYAVLLLVTGLAIGITVWAVKRFS